MKDKMEKIAILSLSLILTSMLAVSGSIPALIQQFDGYSRSSIEFLVSIPAFPMIIMVALSPLLSKILSERVTIIVGLLIAGGAGILPTVLTSYNSILVSRVFLGIGFGLINTRAISIIGERWSGGERATLLGFRVSAETIGQTVMTLVAGQLLAFGWKYPFYVYALAFFILIMYLLFVPSEQRSTDDSVQEDAAEANAVAKKMTTEQKGFVLMNAVFIGLLICVNVSNALRLPSYIVETGIGTSIEASRVLSMMMFTGFLAGLTFGKLMSWLKNQLLTVNLLILGLGLVVIALTSNIITIALGAFLCGFSVTICITCVFNNLSENLSKEMLNTGMAVVLVGCNIGASGAPVVLNWIGLINDNLTTSFLVYAMIIISVGVGVFIFSRTAAKNVIKE
ncbi:MFS transporter [Candidatus Enterococcus mansonii]|uniref:Major facilitator superfamily (MFS) profile domain-containing protein n=1 Tax=Candidatus Enterococcus mansonii TaxID=1834181 RepID=A0A242CBZ3_9ENTE|nr:MFS transporter [Enterococcus sp. 4G2_DIV0659]OTO07767.1 hypothetical protein A5880_002037 [Enterococcus sp. 4G2_DIV0659]